MHLVLERDATARIARVPKGQIPLVPVFFDAEVFAAVRGLIRRQAIDPDQGRQALFVLGTIKVRRTAITPLIAKAFAIRDRFSPYDAFYAIVARLSEATLLICDRDLARAAKGYCKVEYVALR